jgi:ferredoxin-NADP reductase
VTLLFSARSEDDFAFADELAALARRHPQVRVQLASSATTSPRIYPGRIDEALVRAAVPEIAHSICFLCGPKAMIEQTSAILAGLQVPAGQIRHEIFEAAIAAAVDREKVDPAPVAVSSAPGDTHQMRCARSGRTVAIGRDQTLLEAAEAGGIAMESLCRAGVCGTCRTRVTEGSVACTSEALSAAEQSEGFVLACVATAESDCTLDI